MKKQIFYAIVFALITMTSFSQDISKHALGLRLGDSDGLGAEISYQRKLSENNRSEFDLGFRNSNNVNAFKLTGLYQWVWEIENNFNWYAGVGAGIGSYSVKNGKDGTFVNAAGDIGIE